MLTCKVGNTIINCFDGKYDKYTLKKWSEENRLICPDCGNFYEYCHGEVIYPYFRHKEKNKDCEGIYHESETEEHVKGKLILYNWLLKMQSQGIIKDLKLESYIPETKQRPDIFFRVGNKRYVIEFQCTPIATEYLERHRLYQLAGINDIWIMGTYNYNINLQKTYGTHPKRFKTLEKHANYYLDVNAKRLYIKKELIYSKLLYKQIYLPDYIGYKINEYVLDNLVIVPNCKLLKKYIKNDYKEYMKNRDIIEAERKKLLEIETRRNNILEKTKQLLNKNSINYNIDFRDSCPYYRWAIDIELSIDNNNFNYVFFIKENCIDFCKMNMYYPKYENLDSYKNKHICDDDISNFIFRKLSKYKSFIFDKLKCVDCGTVFNFTFGEKFFYDSKCFLYPKRCRKCRDRRKQSRR